MAKHTLELGKTTYDMMDMETVPFSAHTKILAIVSPDEHSHGPKGAVCAIIGMDVSHVIRPEKGEPQTITETVIPSVIKRRDVKGTTVVTAREVFVPLTDEDSSIVVPLDARDGGTTKKSLMPQIRKGCQERQKDWGNVKVTGRAKCVPEADSAFLPFVMQYALKGMWEGIAAWCGNDKLTYRKGANPTTVEVDRKLDAELLA